MRPKYRCFPVLATAAGLLLASSIAAGEPQSAPPSSESATVAAAPDPVALLREANAKLQAVDWLEYDFEFTGAFARSGRVVGHAVVAPGTSFADLGFRADVEFASAPVGFKSEPRRSTVALAEGKAYLLDPERQRVQTASLSLGGGALIRTMSYFAIPMFMRAEPFGIEIERPEEHRWAGRAEVAGVPCDVVFLRFPEDTGLGEQYFYLGMEDRLPRRLVFVSPGSAGVPAMFEWVASDLRYGTGDPPVGLEPEVPPAWEMVDLEPLSAGVGDSAPDWRLRTPTGGTVGSADVAGQVVVLDFWSSWCVFCHRNLPFLARMTEDFDGKPARVFAVQFWDERDPVEFLAEMDLELDVLVDGDELAKAFRVAGTPTAVVIGRDGKMIHRTNKVGEARDEELRRIVAEALAADAVDESDLK